MNFYDSEYSGSDFRKVQRFYTQFFYNEVSTGPGLTWCTQYFYKKSPKGRYRIVLIDAYDNEISNHEEFRLEAFVRLVCEEADHFGLEHYIDDEVLALCPQEFGRYPELVESCFTEMTASLLKCAVKQKDNALINALLPDFDALRKEIRFLNYDDISMLELFRETTVRMHGESFIRCHYDIETTVGLNRVYYLIGTDYVTDADSDDGEIRYLDEKAEKLMNSVYESELQTWKKE